MRAGTKERQTGRETMLGLVLVSLPSWLGRNQQYGEVFWCEVRCTGRPERDRQRWEENIRDHVVGLSAVLSRTELAATD